jgi:hypothetical protein
MKGRTLSPGLFATLLLPMVAQPRLLQANSLSPPSGSYELIARLEFPHLEQWGVNKTTCADVQLQPWKGRVRSRSLRSQSLLPQPSLFE